MTPHTSIFSGPTSCGKTQRALDLLENEYKNHYENIVILCSTLRENKTYLERPWIWEEPFVWSQGAIILTKKTFIEAASQQRDALSCR